MASVLGILYVLSIHIPKHLNTYKCVCGLCIGPKWLFVNVFKSNTYKKKPQEVKTTRDSNDIEDQDVSSFMLLQSQEVKSAHKCKLVKVW